MKSLASDVAIFSLNPVKFFADMHDMLPATLPDIESEIYILKNRVYIWFKAVKSTAHDYSEFCALN